MNFKKQVNKHYTDTKGVFKLSSNLFGRAITRLLLKTPITANQVSILAFLLVFVSALMIMSTNYWIILGGALVLQLTSILDSCDGAIARIKGMSKHGEGEYASLFQHTFTPPIVLIVLSVKTYQYLHNPIYLLICSITILFMYLTQYSRIVKDNIMIEYMLKNNKRLKAKPDLNILIGDEHDRVTKLNFFCKPKNYNILSNLMYIFNASSHFIGIVLIFAVFNITHYLFFFYAPFFILIGIAKTYIEIKRGMSRYEFE